MLSEIVSFLPKFDASFILQYWQNGISFTGMAQPLVLYLLLDVFLTHAVDLHTVNDSCILSEIVAADNFSCI